MSVREMDPTEVALGNGSAAGNTSGVVATYLRDRILEGQLRPGDRIRQEDVAAANGTSRVPVREALRVLESEGLVRLVPHSGATVARLDFHEFSEIYRLREALEPLLLAASVPVLTETQVERLGQLCNETAVAGSKADVNEWIDCDRRFHLSAYVPETMPRAYRIASDFWNRTQQYRRGFVATLDEGARYVINMEHRLLLDAIEKRDAEGAADRLRLHIRRTRLALADRQELFDL
ncbi:GntR family transcriptional regulator [Rhodococcus sp. NPDC060176]|uniref:GntR family transcriptional regulator n=1 Tax=Rhodococcus sp. NPDC060176 TaxID=3347062 RepID=UPI0036544B46